MRIRQIESSSRVIAKQQVPKNTKITRTIMTRIKVKGGQTKESYPLTKSQNSYFFFSLTANTIDAPHS